MSLILICTVLSGVIFSKFLLFSGLSHIVIRYSIVLLFAYSCFFILMRLWLQYLTAPYRKSKRNDSLIDAADVISNFPDLPLSRGASRVVGHGGKFGGGGVSDAWGEAGGVAETLSTVGETTTGAIGEGVTGVGEVVAGLADEGGIVLIPLIVLLVVLLGGGVYLIYEAPVIFSEAAFEIVLAATLIKRAKAIDSPDWIGSVFRATWPAFVLTAAITILAGWAMMHYFPGAAKITDVVRSLI